MQGKKTEFWFFFHFCCKRTVKPDAAAAPAPAIPSVHAPAENLPAIPHRFARGEAYRPHKTYRSYSQLHGPVQHSPPCFSTGPADHAGGTVFFCAVRRHSHFLIQPALRSSPCRTCRISSRSNRPRPDNTRQTGRLSSTPEYRRQRWPTLPICRSRPDRSI